MDTKQFVGWFLVLVGLAIIGYALFASWQIFTGAKEAPEIFLLEQPASEKTPAKSGAAFSPEAQAQELVNQLLQEQLGSMFPEGSMAKLLNLTIWSMLAWLLFLGGGQIAGIGVKLLRNKE